jgi:tRNA nucleotidyltransferase (CCA-adding enzyme)
MIKLSKETQLIIEKLNSCGFKAYIVGGCVRDYLMGLTPSDIDITTNAKPEETKEVFSDFRVIETGIKHGTVSVLVNGRQFEVTTFRIDSEYSDNRHPDSVSFTSNIEEDLARRDFTMNAIAYNEQEGFIDPFGGMEDIENRIIRCVGKPDKRFNEDALRILRALRFSSVTGFDIEENTIKALYGNKELLKNISVERIFQELIKLLCGDNVRKVLLEYVDVLGVVIPELMPMKGFEQKNPYHAYDVLAHTAIVVESIEKKPYLRLAALFHDLGKPHTFSLGEDNIGHFYGHAKLSTQMAIDILKRLKADNTTIAKVERFVRYHDTPIENDDVIIKKRLNKFGKEDFFDLIKLMRADNRGQSPELSYRQKEYDLLEEKAHEILARQECFSLKDLKINGHDIMALGVKEGREVGRILSALLGLVIANKVENSKEELVRSAKLLIEKGI